MGGGVRNWFLVTGILFAIFPFSFFDLLLFAFLIFHQFAHFRAAAFANLILFYFISFIFTEFPLAPDLFTSCSNLFCWPTNKYFFFIIYPAPHFLSAFLWPKKRSAFSSSLSLFITELTHAHTNTTGEN